MRALVGRLEPGDRVTVEHEIKVGLERWWQTTTGTVVRTERRRHGLHHRRQQDDKVWSDVVVLARDDGERTSVAIDEFTRLRKI